jgi:hypothetical protein
MVAGSRKKSGAQHQVGPGAFEGGVCGAVTKQEAAIAE